MTTRGGSPPAGVSFSNNRYFSGLDAAKWFCVWERKSNLDFKAWVEASCETGSEAKQIRYRDPSRTVEARDGRTGHYFTGGMGQAPGAGGRSARRVVDLRRPASDRSKGLKPSFSAGELSRKR